MRYSFRLLRKSPGFTVVALVSLALGIGANTAIFSIVNAVFLHPLPVADPARLAAIYTLDRKNPGYLACSYPNFEDYRRSETGFEDLLLYGSIPLTFTGAGEPELLAGQVVTGNYFSLLGVRPALGRGFLPEEDRTPGAHAVAVIGDGFWRRRFGADPRVVGRTAVLNGHPFRIVGVAPRGFHGLNALVNPDVWVPAMMYQQVLPSPVWFRQRRALAFAAVGRLRPGVDLRQAQAAMNTVAARLEREFPADNQGRSVTLVPAADAALNPNLRGGFLRAGGVVFCVVALVLLIACANVAGLMIARAAGRRREIALRLALGARPAHLVRQLLSESLLLVVPGAALGVALARWGRDLLWSARPPQLQMGAFDVGLDLRVLAFTLLITLAAGALFGLAPALGSLRADLHGALRERFGSSGAALGRGRRLLVGMEIALTMVALAGAGLFVRSLGFAERLDPGFETGRLVVVTLNLGRSGYDPARSRIFWRRAVERVAGLPGIQAAALAGTAPFGNFAARTIAPEQAAVESGDGALVLVNAVDAGYFHTMGVPVLWGRGFAATDGAGAPRVAVVNQTMARRFWPQGAIGRRFRVPGEAAPYEVVGVARDADYLSLGEERRALVYLSLDQNYAGSVTLHARTGGDPDRALAAVRRELHTLAPGLLLTAKQTVRDVVRKSLWAPRLGAGLLAGFGGLALVLAAVGVYGVVSFSVSRRVREIGIRMALGARPADVLAQVMRESMSVVLAGMAAGLIAALAMARLVAGLLFGIGAGDPASYAAVALLLGAVALVACYIPARRATRVDPTVVLREE